MNAQMVEKLRNSAAEFGINLNIQQIHAFEVFAEMLENKNKVLNLTRVKPEDYIDLHFIDSLSAAAVQSFKPGMKLLDIGTGAGLPGIPLAIAFPGLDVTLLDGTSKKLKFLDEVIDALELKCVRTLHGRAEEIQSQPAYSGKYDIVTARAVANIEILEAWMIPFLKRNGVAIAYKSVEIDGELKSALSGKSGLGCTIVGDTRLTLPGTEIERRIIQLARSS